MSIKQTVILCLFIFFSISVLNAQPVLFQDPVSAKTFNSEKYSEIKGSPFLFEKWINGQVITSSGIYKNVSLKLDAYENTLLFNKDDEAREFKDPVTGFTLIPDASDSTKNMVFRKGLSGPSLKPDQYVQVLGEGSLSLYRSDIKLLSDVNEINRGVIKTFNNSTRYYVLKDGSLKLIKPNKKELMGIFDDKREKIESFIKENNLSVTKDPDLKQVISYYNSL